MNHLYTENDWNNSLQQAKDSLLSSISYEKMDIFINLNKVSIQLWITSIMAAIAVGMAGMVPLICIPFTMKCVNSTQNDSCKRLRLMLSYAVGGLLGDVFLHLLPEAWQLFSNTTESNCRTYVNLGYWILTGMGTFICLQMIFSVNENQEFEEDRVTEKSEQLGKQAVTKSNNKNVIIAYLNMLANGIDNFAHGLAVGASFVVGIKIGVLTTLAIIVHEIPHEFADFAILMKSGLSKWNAIRAQCLTASVGIVGTVFALICESYKINGEHSITTYIIPFTAGGFLHIALSSILPELIKEESPKESFKQLFCIFLGIFTMALVNFLAS